MHVLIGVLTGRGNILSWMLCTGLILAGARSWATMQGVCPPESPYMTEGTAGDTLRAVVSVENKEAGEAPLAWHSMVTNVPGDIVGGAGALASGSSIRAVAGIGLVTGLLMATDGTTSRATQDLLSRNPWMQSTCSFIQHIGNGRTHLGIAAAFAVGGFLAGDTRALRTASQTVEGLLATGIVVQALKHVTGRESPAEASQSGGIWRFFPNLRAYNRNQPKYYSFPSGHIATTMTTVTIIAENYPEQAWMRPVGYGIVGLVGVSLVGVKYHWYSDLPVGAALGYLFGKVIVRNEGAAGGGAEPVRESGVSVMPVFGDRGAGISLGVTL